MTVFTGAYRHASFTAGAIASANGLATSFASPVAPLVVTGAALNGALAANLKNGVGPARTVTVSTSASAATYNVGASFPIVVTGKRQRSIKTESLLLVAAGGGDLIIGQQLFDQIISVSIPAQLLGAGAFTIGVDAVGAPMGLAFKALKGAAAGTLNVQFQDGTTDGLVVATTADEPSAAERVLSSTAIGFTCYFE